MKNHEAWLRARRTFAGGVNSPVRAFRAVGGDPIFMERGLGPHLFDADGRRYVDHCLSWGAILHGHADSEIASAISMQAQRGTTFGTVTRAETALGIEIQKAFPRLERLRFTSSGTEAVMSAIRLARGVTGRGRIVKFEGGYHGHADSLLVKAGSGLATFGMPDSLGVPRALAELTSVLPYNDAAAACEFLRKNRDVACVIVEPVAGNMGVVPGDRRFLETLRDETRKSGVLLVFDEVITGYRLCYGGAQHLYKIEPDLTTLGKIVGGGLPIGVFGGRAKFMNTLSPEGGVYQAGTLSGNPISMAAGLAALSRLSPAFYDKLNARAGEFVWRAKTALKKSGARVSVASSGSMFTVFFSPKPPKNWGEAARSDKRAFAKFFRKLLSRGVYFPPSAFETAFLSDAHDDAALAHTLKALL